MRRFFASLVKFSILYSVLVVVIAAVGFGLVDPGDGGGGDDCCSKCGDCSPEFSAGTALIAVFGMAFLLVFFRKRIRSHITE